MIKLSNNHHFEYMAGSGTLGFDGAGWLWQKPLISAGIIKPSLFTVVTQTITFNPVRKGEEAPGLLRHYNFAEGAVSNTRNYENPGIKWWCRKAGPKIRRKRIPIICSIFSQDLQELIKMAWMLRQFELVGLELATPSCKVQGDADQNIKFIADACRATREEGRLPVILKVSFDHPIDAVLLAVRGIAEAISIDSIMQWEFGGFQDRLFSKDDYQFFSWKLLKTIARQNVLPVIGNSIQEFGDIDYLRNLGASAISFDKLFLSRPWLPSQFVKRDTKKHLEQIGL